MPWRRDGIRMLCGCRHVGCLLVKMFPGGDSARLRWVIAGAAAVWRHPVFATLQDGT